MAEDALSAWLWMIEERDQHFTCSYGWQYTSGEDMWLLLYTYVHTVGWRRFWYKGEVFFSIYLKEKKKGGGTTAGVCHDLTRWSFSPTFLDFTVCLLHTFGSTDIRQHYSSVNGVTPSVEPLWQLDSRRKRDICLSLSRPVGFRFGTPSTGPRYSLETLRAFGAQNREIKSSFTAVTLYWDNISAQKPLSSLKIP